MKVNGPTEPAGALSVGVLPSGLRNVIARNTILNLVGQSVPLLVGVIAVPTIVRSLGAERFGLLTLAWVVLGYFSIFDLGLGRATTKHVAEALGRGDKAHIPSLVWSTAMVQAAMGLVGGVVLFLATPLLVLKILRIPVGLSGEAMTMFRFLALSVPLVFVSGSFRGVLEAIRRFDFVNLVNVSALSLAFAAAAAAVTVGLGIQGIVALFVIIRGGAMLAYMFLGLRFAGIGMPQFTSFNIRMLRLILPFGFWIMTSNVILPIFLYLDRFLIVVLQGPTQLSYYVIPYEVVSRTLIIPSSLVMVLFPVFSWLRGAGDPARIFRLVRQGVVTVAVVLGPILLLIAVLAEPALRIWIGPDFAERGAATLRVLAIGVYLSALGYVPSTLVQSIGRPDVPAKFHLVEFPIYALLAYAMVRDLGALGAAWAWVIRLVWHVPILTWICLRVSSHESAGKNSPAGEAS